MDKRIDHEPTRYLELAAPSHQRSEVVARREAAIYVHIPFCTHICTYCDFDTFARREGWIPTYVEAAVEQITRSTAIRATSLYVGGGTPSLLSVEQAGCLLEACRTHFLMDHAAEATMEANPWRLGEDLLRGLRDVGFNRLSLGVQSCDPRLLRLLGRRHGPDDAAAAVLAARAAGFANISVDLLYGVPTQDLESWALTLERVVRWGVDHISCYALSLEPGTPLERAVNRGRVPAPSDDTAAEMYQVARQLLGAAGYRRYEISNWALPGKESCHNITYWKNRPYLGIGAGAAGYWEGRRYKIARSIERYVEGVRAGRLPLQEDEPADDHRAMSDTLVLGLRLEEGVRIDEFMSRHGTRPEAVFGEALRWAEDMGLLERTADCLRLTERGILLSNELFSRLL